MKIQNFPNPKFKISKISKKILKSAGGYIQNFQNFHVFLKNPKFQNFKNILNDSKIFKIFKKKLKIPKFSKFQKIFDLILNQIPALTSWGGLWGILGRLGAVLGGSWSPLGRSWVSWGGLGRLLEPPGALQNRSKNRSET